MRLFGSLGIIFALGGVLAESGSYSDLSVDSKAASSTKHLNNIYTRDHNNDVQTGVISQSQLDLVNNWGRVKKADDLAREFNLHMVGRATIYLPVADDFSFVNYGPNTQSTLIQNAIAIAKNLQPDSKDSIYTDIPPEYRRLAGSKKDRTVTHIVTTTSSSNLRNSGSSSMENKKMRAAAINDTEEEEE